MHVATWHWKWLYKNVCKPTNDDFNFNYCWCCMSEACPNHVSNMTNTCPMRDQYMSEAWPRNMTKSCLKHVQIMSASWPASVCNMRNSCLKHGCMHGCMQKCIHDCMHGFIASMHASMHPYMLDASMHACMDTILGSKIGSWRGLRGQFGLQNRVLERALGSVWTPKWGLESILALDIDLILRLNDFEPNL